MSLFQALRDFLFGAEPQAAVPAPEPSAPAQPGPKYENLTTRRPRARTAQEASSTAAPSSAGDEHQPRGDRGVDRRAMDQLLEHVREDVAVAQRLLDRSEPLPETHARLAVLREHVEEAEAAVKQAQALSRSRYDDRTEVGDAVRADVDRKHEAAAAAWAAWSFAAKASEPADAARAFIQAVQQASGSAGNLPQRRALRRTCTEFRQAAGLDPDPLVVAQAIADADAAELTAEVERMRLEEEAALKLYEAIEAVFAALRRELEELLRASISVDDVEFWARRSAEPRYERGYERFNFHLPGPPDPRGEGLAERAVRFADDLVNRIGRFNVHSRVVLITGHAADRDHPAVLRPAIRTLVERLVVEGRITWNNQEEFEREPRCGWFEITVLPAGAPSDDGSAGTPPPDVDDATAKEVP